MSIFSKKAPIVDNKQLLSDHDILSEIVDINIARKNLSDDEFKKFYEVYLKYSQSNEKYTTYMTQHKNRRFSIAYSFEAEGIPFGEICCDDAVWEEYNNSVKGFEDNMYSVIADFANVIDCIAYDNNINRGVTNAYGCVFMRYSFELIRHAKGINCLTEYLPTLLNASLNNYTSFVIKTFMDKDHLFSDMLMEFKNQMKEQFQQVLNRRGVTEDCLYDYAKIMMDDIGAPEDETNYKKLESVIWNWSWIAKKYHFETK